MFYYEELAVDTCHEITQILHFNIKNVELKAVEIKVVEKIK